MARSAILGNGRLAVGLNKSGFVHDFYYPYVGLDNLTTARSIRHKIGVWVDGAFSWVDDGEGWEHEVQLCSDAQITEVIMRNDRLGVEIHSKDFVDYEYDYFCRILEVHNNGEAVKDIRLFMHQVFEISTNGRADTALYVPEENYILDYKGRCCLLISGETSQGNSFDQFAVGNYGIEGKKGTFMDAEDGELSGNLIEHAGVDSVIRFKLNVEAGESQTVNYWIVASDTQIKCEDIHFKIKASGDKRLQTNRSYWASWLSKASERISILPEHRQTMIKQSLMTIKAHIDSRGGIIASCDSSIYNYGRDYYSYVWPRDGALTLWPLIRLGYTEEAKAFFDFCADIVTDDGYLMHKYQPDRAIGSTWHPLVHAKRRELAIQEDETATVLIMIGEFFTYSKDIDAISDLYNRFVVKAANFLSGFVDSETGLPHPTYDLWEEKFLTSTYTTATVYRALIVASELAHEFGEDAYSESWQASAESLLSKYGAFINPDRGGFRKGLIVDDKTNLQFDNTLDTSSFYGVMTFGYQPHGAQDLHKAIKEIEASLLNQNKSGGSPRYENDNYFKVQGYPGNPWIISTLWIAQYYIRTSRFDDANKLIEWVESKALPSGVLSEQINPENGETVSVAPLVWSHAEYINTVLDFAHKQQAN